MKNYLAVRNFDICDMRVVLAYCGQSRVPSISIQFWNSLRPNNHRRIQYSEFMECSQIVRCNHTVHTVQVLLDNVFIQCIRYNSLIQYNWYYTGHSYSACVTVHWIQNNARWIHTDAFYFCLSLGCAQLFSFFGFAGRNLKPWPAWP